MSEQKLAASRLARQCQLSVESAFTVLLLALGWAIPACAHPFHISTAEVEYDAQTDRLQVSLKLQAIDLEQALARLAGKRIVIEQAEAAEQIAELLGRSFYVSAEAKESPRSQIHWVGQELKGAWLWLYFELELPPQRAELRLFNTILFDSNDSQINTVSVRHGNQRTTLKLTPKQPSAKFESQWLKPK